MRLRGGLTLASAALVLACTTPGTAPRLPVTQHQPETVTTLRISPEPPVAAEDEAAVWFRAAPLDLEHWPFGWVNDSEAWRFGLSERFWSEKKSLWSAALDPAATPASAAFRLQRVYGAVSGDEAFRAAWRLWQINTRAGLGGDARSWLDRADDLKPLPSLALERAWDQAFRLRDLQGARALWADVGAGASWPEDLDRKVRLLRQKLFLGTRSLAPDADDYVSALELDHEDLWAATWDGAVVRWSLVTGDFDLIKPAGDTVSPIKCLAVTGWFVYAFQDKGLLRYSKVTGTWRTFPYPVGWNGLRIQGAVPLGEETLWVGHLGEGLWKWDRGQWTLADAGGGGPFINALAADGRGGLWIGTKDNGLWSWNGGWSRVPSENGSPDNITVISPSPDGTSWAVGTWGEGTWRLRGGILRPEGVRGNAFVTAAAWDDDGPVWGTLDQGLFSTGRALGPLDGAPTGVSALVMWQGRWIWGTSGQGLGWWSEDENPALSR